MSSLFSSVVFLISLIAPFGLTDDLPPGVLARGENIEITESAFHDYLTTLYLKKELGQSLLEQLIREEVISQESERRNISISQARMESRIKSLELQIRVESGGEKGLEQYLKEKGVQKDEFFDALRLSIAHEVMARHDFEMAENEEIPSEKLNLWLRDLIGKSRVKTEDLEGDALAWVGEKKIGRPLFGKRLISLLPPTEASALLTEYIGIGLIRNYAEESGFTLDKADADQEIREREARLKEQPGFEQVSLAGYIMAVQGLTLEELKASEKFQGEVLLKKICDAKHHEAYLKEYFEKHQDHFNHQFGRAARLSTIFLQGVKFPNQFVHRKFEEAKEELAAIKTRIVRGEVRFEDMARVYSEHESKKTGGDLGFIPLGTPGWEEVVAAALLAEEGSLLGPIQTESGCHLLKVCGKRDNPAFEAIRDEVARDARDRFYRNLLNEAKIERKI
ncbi:MAG: peptidylprolyl isomerase [Planctomycetes bacterium]|nr:peptidylprolyl isomerase [Planctomycetota bacterium]